MRFRTSVVLCCLAVLMTALAVQSAQKDSAPAAEPRYETSSNVDIMVVVADVKDVPAGNPLSGMHLMVRPESARANSETTDVYLAPDDYLKDFNTHFVKGDRLQVKGSKVKYNGGIVVLAREVRSEATTVYLRDEQGVPYWQKS